MRKVMSVGLVILAVSLLAACANLKKPLGLSEVPSTGDFAGVEETPATTSPAVLSLGNDSKPREVRIKVSEAHGISEVYSTFNPAEPSRQNSPASNMVKFTNVTPGKKYNFNLRSTSNRWACENDPPSSEVHRALTFNIWVSVNGGDWVLLGSADTELVAGQWWNLAIYVP